MRKIRYATDADFPQIEAIRIAHGSTAPMPQDLLYRVVENDGEVTVCFALKWDGPNRALVADFYGSNAYDWEFAFDKLCERADEYQVELSGWCFLNNKNTKYFARRGFKEEMRLFRRQPQQKEVKV